MLFRSGGENNTISIKFEHKDGQEVSMLRRGNIVEWDGGGNPVRVIGVHIDITDSVTKEKELNIASESLHIVDGNAMILWANEKELNGLGYSKDEYIGESIIDFHVDKIVINDMLTVLLGGGTLDNYPARVKGKDGSEKQVLINSSGYFNEDGTFSHTRCFSRVMNDTIDISDMISENIKRIQSNKGD